MAELITDRDKIREFLIRRGFAGDDIDTGFANYKGEWNIKTITKEQVASAKTVEELEPLFRKDSLEYRFCDTSCNCDFGSFAEEIAPFEVSPSELDPYIARLVRAVNEIGVKTIMSCDGWHRRTDGYGGMRLYMRDRYSLIWFWLIAEHIFGERWKEERKKRGEYWDDVWEPFDRENQFIPVIMMRYLYNSEDYNSAMKAFEKSNTYAEFLENNKTEFLRIRNELIDGLRKKQEAGAIEDIDHINFMRARRYMEEIFLPLSKPLAEKFAREYPDK